MRILLINPPTFYYTGITVNALPSIAPAILAGLFNRSGHETDVIDMDALEIDPTKQNYQPGEYDVVGITGMTMAAQGIRDTISSIRRSKWQGKIVVGGIHASMNPIEVKRWGADLVVTGECEGNIVSLLQDDETGIHKGIRLPIDMIPAPDWNHYKPDITTYRGNYPFMRPNPGISMWSRGCPYACVYCSNLLYQNQPTRYRPPEHIAAEMADLKRRGVEHVYVYDDELIGGRQPDGWMQEIADRIEHLGLRWVTMGRCSERHITPQLLKDMKRAGCTTILWGVESFSQHALDAMKKRNTTDDIWYSLRAAKAAGIKSLAFLMIGNYQENENDLVITKRAITKAVKEGILDYLQIFVTGIMPGTELERLSKLEGWYQPAELGNAKMKSIHHGTPWLSAETIRKYQHEYKKAAGSVAL